MSSTRILVADDDQTTRLLMQAALAKAGLTVELAADGEQALAAFARTPFDMVMLDVDMPRLNFADRQARDIYHGKSKLVTPIAITLFFWILLLNATKFIPADFIAKPLELLGVPYWKPVPTADVNATLGLSISVFFLTLFFALKSKGVGGLTKEFLTAPFGKWMVPFNLILNIVEWLSKPVSLAMRLFGNMFGGEIVFLLIWVLGGAGILGMLGGATFGLGWMIFHILVVPLQAFIFMMLSIVYLSLAEDSH